MVYTLYILFCINYLCDGCKARQKYEKHVTLSVPQGSWERNLKLSKKLSCISYVFLYQSFFLTQFVYEIPLMIISCKKKEGLPGAH